MDTSTARTDRGADGALDALRPLPEGAAAVRIGRYVPDQPGHVVMRTRAGARRTVDTPVGERLRRIR